MRTRDLQGKFRWKRVAKFVVHVEQSSTARMWRIVTSKDATEPQLLSPGTQATCALGAGEAYEGRVLLRRIKKDFDPGELPS